MFWLLGILKLRNHDVDPGDEGTQTGVFGAHKGPRIQLRIIVIYILVSSKFQSNRASASPDIGDPPHPPPTKLN